MMTFMRLKMSLLKSFLLPKIHVFSINYYFLGSDKSFGIGFVMDFVIMVIMGSVVSSTYDFL